MATNSFDICLRLCLEHKWHVLTPLTKSFYFKGNLASMAIWHLTQAQWWPLILYTQSAVSTKASVIRAQAWPKTSVFLSGGTSALWALWKTRQPQTFEGESNPDPTRDHSWIIYASAFHYRSHRINFFKIAQQLVQKFNVSGFWVITSQIALVH